MNDIKEYSIPEYFAGGKNEGRSVYIRPYSINKSRTKNRVVVTAHLFSFLTEGSKEIVMGDATIKLNKTEFVLIPAGRCFMSEKISGEGSFSTMLFFFDNNLLQTFFELQEDIIEETIKENNLSQTEILLFQNDDFTKSYVQTIKFFA